MNVLITGGTGFIGSAVSRALADGGHRVVPVSRTTGGDFTLLLKPSDWMPYLSGIDTVINSVGIIGERNGQRFDVLHRRAPIALFEACAEVGVRRVVQVSALGADESAFSAYHLSKRAADDALRAMDLDWFIVRPSLIYGLGGGSADLFMRLARLPRIPVIAGGVQQLQPVHISDVVATILACLTTDQSRQTLDVVGAETVSFAAWLQRMRQAQGLAPTSLFSVSYGLAMLMAYFAGTVHPLFQQDNLRMLRRGYHADVQPLARFLGRMPTAAEPWTFFANETYQGSRS